MVLKRQRPFKNKRNHISNLKFETLLFDTGGVCVLGQECIFFKSHHDRQLPTQTHSKAGPGE